MLFPLLLVIVVLYVLLGLRLFRGIFRLSRTKAWVATVISAFVVFGGDHLAGLAYAHLWVRAVPNPPALPIATDRLALEFDFLQQHSSRAETDLLRAYAMQMVNPEYWQGKGTAVSGPQTSYAKVQVVVRVDSKEKIFDMSVTTDGSNEGCRAFFAFPGEDQQRWRSYASLGLENGREARCVSITPAAGVKAEYLYRVASRQGTYLEQALGANEVSVHSLLALPSRELLVEWRHVWFSGGWVQRTFWTSFSTGITARIPIGTPGPKPSIRAASRQRAA